MLSGAREPAVRKVCKGVSCWGEGQSTIVGNRLEQSPLKLSSPWAAFVNGTSAHSQDFDDVLDFALAHVSAVLVPALLALAEETSADGHQCLDAYIVGFEILAKIGELLNPNHYQRGWHTTLTLGSPAAAAACGRLIGLDRRRMQSALSLSTSMSAGSKRQFGTMAKPIHAGLAAKNGILAARLAAEDITAAKEMLEGPWTLSDLMHGSGSADPRDGFARIGDPPALVQYGVWLKRYPCCASAHRSIDAILHLRSIHGFSIDQITNIEAVLPKVAADNLMYASPQDPMEARFSLHYCVASALIDGHLGPDSFTLDAIQRSTIHSLLPRIHKIVNRDYDVDQRSSVKIKQSNGKVLFKTVKIPRGHPGLPLTDDELAGKFRACAKAGRLNETEIESLGSKLTDLICLPRLDQLTKYL
jgi:2-methylcitrate dehydratase PrpD